MNSYRGCASVCGGFFCALRVRREAAARGALGGAAVRCLVPRLEGAVLCAASAKRCGRDGWQSAELCALSTKWGTRRCLIERKMRARCAVSSEEEVRSRSTMLCDGWQSEELYALSAKSGVRGASGGARSSGRRVLGAECYARRRMRAQKASCQMCALRITWAVCAENELSDERSLHCVI